MLTGTCHCGALTWTFDGDPGSATACNCTVCRRYGTLWIYDWEDGSIRVSGPTTAYTRPGGILGFHFCPTCGCVGYWRPLVADPDGRRRMAVNVRLSHPDLVAHLPIDPFDGLDSFTDLPQDGRQVRHLWA